MKQGAINTIKQFPNYSNAQTENISIVMVTLNVLKNNFKYCID